MIVDELKFIKVSIIIPVYNVEKYLRRCLESCVNQTLQEIEIIVVNDCSPYPLDSEIMREYEAQYPHKIRCIWHSENKKQGGARNTGIAIARGEYINFVDGDDFIEPEMCEKLYTAAKETMADYVYCDHYAVRGENRKRIHRYTELDAGNEEALHPLCMACGNITKRDIFISNKLQFAEGLRCVEDVPMTFLLLILANKIFKLEEPLYNYCIHAESTIQSSTVFDRIPFTYLAFNQTRELCKTVLNSAQMFIWDTKTIVWLFNYLFLFYGYTHKNNIGMSMEYVCRNNINISREELHKSNIDMFTGYIRKNNIDMFMIIYSIKNNYKKEKIQLLWELLKQQKESQQLQEALFNFHVSYIAKRIKQLGFEDKSITIWGSGERGLQIGKYLQCASIPFSVVDVDTKRHGLILVDDIPIDSWEKLKDSTDVVIATPKLCYYEIRKQIDNSIAVIDMEELLK